MNKPNRLQFGVMHHLTGSTPAMWDRDLGTLADAGFGRVVLAENNDDPRVLLRALALCHKHGLQGYPLLGPTRLAHRLIGSTNRLVRDRSIGIDGQTLKFFNPFDPAIRRRTIVPAFRSVAKGLRGVPGFAGIFIDDTMDAESIISYMPGDAKRFRAFLRERYDGLDALSRAWGQSHKRWEEITPPRIMLPWRDGWRQQWHDWSLARQHWWLGWADDVLAALKPAGEIERILGDDWYSVRFGYDVTGGFTPELVERFDSFSFDYTAGIDYLDRKLTNFQRDIAMAKDVAGRLRTTVFLKAASRGAAPFPEAKAIIRQTEKTIEAGAAGIDYYIYRAAPGNYAHKNCLANYPKVFKELARFVIVHGKPRP